MLPLGSIDKDSSLTSPLAACAAKLKFKHKNILSWSAIYITHPHIYAISS